MPSIGGAGERLVKMDKLKIIMVILLLAMEIPAAIALVVGWRRACKAAREVDNE